MMVERTGLTEAQVQEVRDRSLEAAYEPHDLGQRVLEARLHAHGFTVEQHGTDARHIDEVILGDGPDLLVRDDGETVAFVEVKTKTDPDWFGRLNLRHYREYVNFANEVEAPVFVWFALVDEDADAVVRDAFVEVADDGQIDADLYDASDEEVVFYEDDIERIDDDMGLVAVDGGDVVGVHDDQTIVETIPDVWGNEVVELSDSEFRSMPYVLHRIGDGYDDGYAGVDERSVDAPRHVTSLAATARQLHEFFWNHVQQNPADDSVYHVRTMDGRIGPRIPEDGDVSLSVNEEGMVTAYVDGEWVVLGCIE